MRSNAAAVQTGQPPESTPPPVQAERRQSAQNSQRTVYITSRERAHASSSGATQPEASRPSPRAGTPTHASRTPARNSPRSESSTSRLCPPSSRLSLQTLPFSLQTMPQPDSGRESPGLAPITRQLWTGSKIPSVVTGSTSPRSRGESPANGSASQLISTSIPTIQSQASDTAVSRQNSAPSIRSHSKLPVSPEPRARAAQRRWHTTSSLRGSFKTSTTAAGAKSPESSASREGTQGKGGMYTTLRCDLRS